jgi:plasmid stability protein
MATLYVRDVPPELYEQLRREAASSRRSLSAEAIELLRSTLAPNLRDVSMGQFLRSAERIRGRHPLPSDSPAAAELIREDRER